MTSMKGFVRSRLGLSCEAALLRALLAGSAAFLHQCHRTDPVDILEFSDPSLLYTCHQQRFAVALNFRHRVLCSLGLKFLGTSMTVPFATKLPPTAVCLFGRRQVTG